ncbi:hypothetical protein OAL44_00645 [Planctomycetaceae bacterium]|nr:hypothetical protein [Planctomycetaceae bacterium]
MRIETADTSRSGGTLGVLQSDFGRYELRIIDLQQRRREAAQMTGQSRTVNNRLNQIEASELREQVGEFENVLKRRGYVERAKEIHDKVKGV